MLNYLMVNLLYHGLILWKIEAYIIVTETKTLRMFYSFTIMAKNSLTEHNKTSDFLVIDSECPSTEYAIVCGCLSPTCKILDISNLFWTEKKTSNNTQQKLGSQSSG